MKNEYHKTVMIFLATLVVAMVCVLFSGCGKEETQVVNHITFDNRHTEYQATFQYHNFDIAVSLNPGTTSYMERVFSGSGSTHDLVGEPYTLSLFNGGVLVCSYEDDTSTYNRVDTMRCITVKQYEIWR